MDEFEALFNRGESVLRSTAPLYRVGHGDRLDLFATALFIQHARRHFVVGAAHALVELRDRRLAVGGEGSVVQLEGPFFHTGTVGQIDFDSDSFDAAFVPLNKEQVAHLDGTVFLSDHDFDATAPSRRNEAYYAVGFIASDYRDAGSQHVGEVRATGISACAAGPESYTHRGVSAKTHLLLSFDRRKIHSATGKSTSPKLAGMSGGGIWRRDHSQGRERIVAVLIEHHQKEGKYIVATRVSTITGALTAFANGVLNSAPKAV